MLRAVTGALLLASLFAASAAAQRGGVGFRGGASAGAHSSLAGGHGFRGSFSPPFSREHSHRNRGSTFLYPYAFPYDEPYGYEEPYADVVAREPAPPVAQPPAPQVPPEPKLIEVPGAANAAPAKPLPPAVFVLTSGERVEVSRFLLRANEVSVTVNRQQRTIPVSKLDLDATLAANRDRGIELEIPTDPNEISLRF